MISRVEWTLALQGLWRQKVRSLLTLVGIAVGAMGLAFSVALSLGLRAFIEREFQGRAEFWRVLVHVDPTEGDVAAAPAEVVTIRGQVAAERRQRLQEALAERYFTRHPRRGERMLTPQRLAELATLPDVEAVQAYRTVEAQVRLPESENIAVGTLVSGPLEELQPRLLSGRLPHPGQPEVVVSELVLYDLGRGNDTDLEQLVGKEVTVRLGRIRQSPPLALARALTGRLVGDELTYLQLEAMERLAQQLPHRLDAFELSPAERRAVQALLAPASSAATPSLDAAVTIQQRWRICGVVRLLTREEKKRRTPLDNWELARADLFVSSALGEAVLRELPWIREGDVGTALLRVRPRGDVLGVVQAVEARQLRTISAAKWFASAQREVALIATGLNLFALLALAVAAVGIANTLVTSVLERTREMGILHAVGATPGQLQRLVLLEGGLLGLGGSLVGLLLAWLLMWPAEAWLHAKVAQLAIEEKLLTESLFVTPWWLWPATGLFALAWTLLAAWFPARRASRLDPVRALRYE
ncbi:MAG: ABC transporter permease [Gemmataceae bacterium]|nr:ABC transporter permease [Gemmataceae bacterium]